MASQIRTDKMESGIPCSSSESCCLEATKIAQIKDANHCNAFDCNHLGPSIPLPDREYEIAVAGSETPLTSISASSTSLRLTSSNSDGTEFTGSSPDVSTPKSHVFDPFAPGREELNLAPHKKPLGESCSCVARRLKFDSDCDSVESLGEESEESLLVAIYEFILDFVLSKQVAEISAKNLPLECSLSNGFQKPRYLPRSTGFADTCPGAPVKPVSGSRVFTYTSLYRKLKSFKSGFRLSKIFCHWKFFRLDPLICYMFILQCLSLKWRKTQDILTFLFSCWMHL